MKHEITNLEFVPKTKEDIKEALRELQKEVKPEDWRYLTEQFTCKLEDVIKTKGMATIH